MSVAAPAAAAPSRWRDLATLVAAALLLHLLLVQPNHPAAATWGALRLFPLELPVILGLLVALPARGAVTAAVRALIVAALVLVAVLKLADFGTFTAFNRSFNPAVDLHLVVAGVRLLAGSVGIALAVLAILGALAAVGAAAWALWWATGRWARAGQGRALRMVVAVVALGAGVVAAAEIGQVRGAWRLPVDPPGAAFTARVGLERAVAYRTALADLRAFREAAQSDPFATAAPLLDRIDGRDVIIVFVESYGRASFETPLYAPTHAATLARAEDRLAAEGLAMRSGWLTAPMVGGQSWLAHATLANGLWVSNQTRHGAALASARETLFHIAGRSGFHTAAVMPAITLEWPEAAFMGFETVLPAAELGYRGEPFNWVTMPDQFTLDALERRLRGPGRDRPLFAQVALVSSHAPWVPIPPLLDWDEIGDGSVFTRWATSGPSPEEVWRDHDRVRDQYRRAIDYSLRTVFDYATRAAGGTAPLLIVLGDHQTAPFVSQSDGFDVPIHVVGPPDLVALVNGWGWAEGLIPAADTPAWPMDAFRDRFLRAFSGDAPGP